MQVPRPRKDGGARWHSGWAKENPPKRANRFAEEKLGEDRASKTFVCGSGASISTRSGRNCQSRALVRGGFEEVEVRLPQRRANPPAGRM